MGKCYSLQESRISTEWKSMPRRPCNIITAAMIEEDVTSFAAHKVRISDFLLEGMWHTENDGCWTFHDGDIGRPTNGDSSLIPMHFR